MLQVDKFAYLHAVFVSEILIFALPIMLGLSNSLYVRILAFQRVSQKFRVRNESLWTLLKIGYAGAIMSFLARWKDALHRSLLTPQTKLSELNPSAREAESVVVWIPGTWYSHGGNLHPLFGVKITLLSWLNSKLSVPGADERWCAVQSQLAKAFPNALIYVFDWAGTNDQTERNRAASTLQAELLKLDLAQKGLPIFLIGHSHGGSVGHHAASSWSGSSKIFVATLGTPFVEIQANAQTLSLKREGDSLLSRATISLARQVVLMPIVLTTLLCSLLAFGAMGFSFQAIAWIPAEIENRVLPDQFRSIKEFTGFTMFATVFLVGIVGYSKAIAIWLTSGFAFANVTKLHLTDLVKNSSAIAIRIRDDQMLNTLDAASRIHRLRFAARELEHRQTQKIDFVQNMFAYILAVFLFLKFLSVPLYQFCLLTALKLLPSGSDETLSYAAFIGFVSLVALAMTAFKFQLMVLAGYSAGEVIFDTLSPFSYLLTISQSRLAGLPFWVLGLAYLRIADHPHGVPLQYASTSSVVDDAPDGHKHSLMLLEPDVWNSLWHWYQKALAS